MSNKIVISYSIDENYAPLAAVSMASVLKNSNENDELTFIILYRNLSEKIIGRIQDIVKIKNCEIKFKKIDEGEFKDFPLIYWVTEETWYRCKLPVLFTEYDKVLYLDCDTMVTGSLWELYNTNLEGNYIAGAQDICGTKNHKKRLNLNNDEYFNAGVLLINCKKWREDNMFEKIKEYSATAGKLTLCDQDALNKMTDGKKIMFSQKYNYMEMWWDNYYHEYEGEDLKNYEGARTAPTIVHFTHTKPLSLKCKHGLKLQWWEYAKLTSFYGDLISNLYAENKNLVKDALDVNKIRAKYIFMILLCNLSFGGMKTKFKQERVRLKNKLVGISAI